MTLFTAVRQVRVGGSPFLIGALLHGAKYLRRCPHSASLAALALLVFVAALP